jgi:alanine dehydrogenase
VPEVLLLTGDDVRDLLGMSEAIEAVENAFKDFAAGRASMPPKTYLDFPQFHGDLRVMPASIGSNFAGVKVVNSHSQNPQQGLPTIMGTYLLVSQETGVPLGIIEGTYLTAVRTGAASAVATKYLAKSNASSVGLVGSGVQATFQLEAMMQVRDVTRAKVWSPSEDRVRRDAFVEAMGTRFPGLQLSGVDQIDEAAAAEVVCTTTPSRKPIVMDGMINPGTHINAVGADGPGKQELDPAILRRAILIVDEWHQASHGGEINVPLSNGELSEDDVSGALPDVVAGTINGRASADDVTVFDSTGLAIEDIAVAALVYERAVDKHLGTRVNL